MKKVLVLGLSASLLTLFGCGTTPEVIEEENVVVSDETLIDETITEVEGLIEEVEIADITEETPVDVIVEEVTIDLTEEMTAEPVEEIEVVIE